MTSIKPKKWSLGFFALVIVILATTPWWAPSTYNRLKRKLAEKHAESSLQLEEVGNLVSAVEKTKAAHKLAPENLQIARQLGKLLEKHNLQEALEHYEKLNANPKATVKDKIALARLAMRSGNLPVAEAQLATLSKSEGHNKELEYYLLSAKTFEARGQIDNAIREIRTILSKDESAFHTQAKYLFVRLGIRSGNSNLMGEAKKMLYQMSEDSGSEGIEAIRFFFGISGYTQKEAMDIFAKTFNHPLASLEDKLQAAIIHYRAAPHRSPEIIATIEREFDLSGTNPNELFIFCRWLARIKKWEALERHLMPEFSLLLPELFTLRLDALANLNRWELLAQETNNKNAPISNHFRMVFRARALARLGEKKKALDQLDRLLQEVKKNRDALLKTCEYLEKTQDVDLLTYLLHRIIEIDPVLESYAFRKLLTYESNSASLTEICTWYEKLHEEGKNISHFQAKKAYYDLLANRNTGESFLIAKSLYTSNPNKLENRILMALGHWRSGNPKAALKILEEQPKETWDRGRIGWKMIYSKLLEKNGYGKKAQTILESLATAKLTRAEREGLQNL